MQSKQSQKQVKKGKKEPKTKPIEKAKRGRKPKNEKKAQSQELFDFVIANTGSEDRSEKKERRRSETRLGRPIQDQNRAIKVLEDPTSDIQQYFLEYLDKIGLSHGLVFREQERAIFQKQNLGIEWNQNHQWDEEKEAKKVENNPEIMGPIRRYAGGNQELIGMLVKCFVNIGEIATEECTQEIYEVLASALQSILKKQEQFMIKLRARKFISKSKFMAGKFTNERNIKYWVQLRCPFEEIELKFARAFKKILISLRMILQDHDKIKKYLQQQEKINSDLQKISRGEL